MCVFVVCKGIISHLSEIVKKKQSLAHQSVEKKTPISFCPSKVVRVDDPKVNKIDDVIGLRLLDLNKSYMKKRMLKKSDVLREGYVKGLKKAQSIINERISFSIGEQRRGIDMLPLEQVLEYRVKCAEEEMSKIVDLYKKDTEMNINHSWELLKGHIENIRQILNKKFGRGLFRK